MEMRDNIKVNVRLIKAEEDRQIWADNYLKRLNVQNIFEIQDEIAHHIVESLKVKLSNGEAGATGLPRADNLESYCLNARAKWYCDQRTKSGMLKAISLYKQALGIDENYAMAWVGLADALMLLHDYGYIERDEVMPEAELALNRAYQLEPKMAETQATLGLLMADKRKIKEAIAKLELATKIRPGYSDAFNWLGWVYNVQGKAELALVNSMKAVELNPLSPEAISNLSLAYLHMGELEKAIRQAKHIQVLNPEWTTGYLYEAIGLLFKGDFNAAEKLLHNLEVNWAGNVVDNLLAMIWYRTEQFRKYEKAKIGFQENGDHFGTALCLAMEGNHNETLVSLSRIKIWDYWNSIAIFSLLRSVFQPVKEKPEFLSILKNARSYWGA